MPQVLVFQDDTGFIKDNEFVSEPFPVLRLVSRPEITDLITDGEKLWMRVEKK